MGGFGMTGLSKRALPLVKVDTKVASFIDGPGGSMMKKAFRRMDEWQEALAERRIPDLLAYGLSIFSIVLGLTMIIGPESYSTVVSFKPAFDLASPQGWGSGFAVTGVLLGLGFWRDRKSGQYAAVVMTALFGIFGFLAAKAPIENHPGSVWSGPIVYTFVSYISAVCVIACSAADKRGT